MKACLVAILATLALSAQSNKPFIQAELIKTIKAKSAKQGDAVTARTANAIALPGEVNIPQGTVLLGEVRAASSTSLTISFDQAEIGGKKTPLSLSIRAAMLPTGPQTSVAAQAGAVIGMPGVTLHVDDSPQHASKFATSGKELQLNKGLQLMLAVPE